MVKMINKTIQVGRITKDVELRYTQSNIAFTRFTLAVNRSFTESDGERKADFISCIAWRKQAENMSKYVHKGNLLGIEGWIQTGSYEDKNGNRVYTTDVVCDNVQFLEPKDTRNQAQRDGQAVVNERKQEPSVDVQEDDSLPF